jgi:pimeloyl-ACP methyl ester carboxylesterase
MSAVRQEQVTIDDLTFDIRIAGDPGGVAVVLLHGFPETSYMWEAVMADLAGRGFYCVAPDQRGYSPGARPGAVESYDHRHLGQDVLDIATAVGMTQFHLVGHDWGAGAGWCAVDIDRGLRIKSYAALSIPHYHAFAQATWEAEDGVLYRSVLEEILVPGRVEESWAADNLALFRAQWQHHSVDAVDLYLQMFSAPGGLTGPLNWYRATHAHRTALDGTSLEFGPVDIPTMLVWGRNDLAVSRLGTELARPLMRGPYEFFELEAGHFLLAEQPEFLTSLIRRHICAHPI